MTRSEKILSYSPYAYWPMSDGSGTTLVDHSGNGYNVTATGIAWDAGQGHDGDYAPRFDGANDYVNIPSGHAMMAGFPRQEGAFVASVRNFPGALSDNTTRVIAQISGNGNVPRIAIQKLNTKDTYRWQWTNNSGANFGASDIGGQSNYNWLNVGVTWSISGQLSRNYITGIFPSGYFGGGVTGWNTAFASPMSSIFIGGLSTPANVFNGWIRDAAFFSSALSHSVMMDVMGF